MVAKPPAGTVIGMLVTGVPEALPIWKVIVPPGLRPLGSVAFRPVL